MGVKASPETIRAMKKELKATIDEIGRIQSEIKGAASSASGWDDAQATQFNSLMKKIASLTEAPVSTLKGSMPKLEKLAQSLEQYNKVKF